MSLLRSAFAPPRIASSTRRMRQCREERGDRHHLLVVEEERIMPDILADGVNRSARWGQVGTEEPERVISKSRVVIPSRGMDRVLEALKYLWTALGRKKTQARGDI